MAKLIEHPCVQHKLAIIRDVETGHKRFRELAKEITKRLGPLPIVFMTGYADDAHVAGRSSAPRDLLRKPFDEHELAGAINAQLMRLGEDADPTA